MAHKAFLATAEEGRKKKKNLLSSSSAHPVLYQEGEVECVCACVCICEGDGDTAKVLQTSILAAQSF